MCLKSSYIPTVNIITIATMMLQRSTKMLLGLSKKITAIIETANAMNIPTPPSVGVGRRCHRPARGITTCPVRKLNQRITGTRIRLVMKAMISGKSVAYDKGDSPLY